MEKGKQNYLYESTVKKEVVEKVTEEREENGQKIHRNRYLVIFWRLLHKRYSSRPNPLFACVFFAPARGPLREWVRLPDREFGGFAAICWPGRQRPGRRWRRKPQS